MILDNSSTIVTMERPCCNLIPSKVLQKSNLPYPTVPHPAPAGRRFAEKPETQSEESAPRPLTLGALSNTLRTPENSCQ